MKKVLNMFRSLLKRFNAFAKKNKKVVVLIPLLVYTLYVFVDTYMYEQSIPKEVSYVEFRQDLEDGKIDAIYYSEVSDMMRYTLYTDETRAMTKKERDEYEYDKEDWRITQYPAGEGFRENMLKFGVALHTKSFDPMSTTLIFLILQLTLPFVMILFLFKIMLGNQGKFKSNSVLKETNIKFTDVIGHNEVVDDLNFIVELMRNPNKGKSLGATIPKGMLFVGPPGTGKTLLAKAIAGESGVPFLYMNASSFVEMYVGLGAKRVRELFTLARKMSPCIVFIDEIDSIGKKRGGRNSHSETDQTLNALLTEMDGFDTESGIFVIGATNNADELDPALRTGRFDRRVVISPPKDWKIRAELFKHFLGDVSLSEEFNIEHLAKQTTGFTGSDINAIVNEAKLIALMQDVSYLTTAHVEEAIDKQIFKGNRSKKDRFDKDNKIVAYHEAGHAVMTYLLGQPIARASIIGTTSGVGGMVMQSEKQSQFYTKKELEAQVMIAFGGRCSEEIKFSDVTTGASSDISQATDIIQSYISKYGFEKEFGMLDMERLQSTAIVESKEILKLMSDMSKRLEKETLAKLKENYFLVEFLANKLLELETISGDGISELMTQQLNLHKS